VRLRDPLLVFALALLARVATASGITFPIPEDSSYYVAVARNLAAGRGLVTDVLWSYATPPLAVPRPAFDLWQPLASFVAAPFMAVLGPSLAAAQIPSVLLGAALGPLAWLIARDAARQLDLPEGRASIVAFTGGLLVALAPLLVIQSAEPDSSAPYAILAVAACALMPAALARGGASGRARVLLGIAIGLAYLARNDAIYLLAAFLVLATALPRADQRPVPGSGYAGRLMATLATAAVLVVPWLVRQAVVWDGSPIGQLVENAWVVRPTDIFGWSLRPTLGSYLAMGPGGLMGLRVDAFVGDLLLVLIGAFPAAVIGVIALIARPRLAAIPALRPLTLVAALTVAVDVLVFPVAGRAGLWAHGSGPAIVLLAVAAAFALDALVARAAAIRGWRPLDGPFSRAGLIAPLGVAIVATPLLALSASLEHERSTTTQTEYAALASVSSRWDAPAGRPVVTDHPMWASEALGRPALVLPREPPPAVLDLMRRFGAVAVVIRDDDPSVVATALLLATYRDGSGRACFPELPAVAPFRVLGFACATETAALGTAKSGTYTPGKPASLKRVGVGRAAR
jgi:hypothetical protein